MDRCSQAWAGNRRPSIHWIGLAAGALPVGDMLPETAYVKLMWAMGQTDDYEEVNKLMLTNIAGEMTERREL